LEIFNSFGYRNNFSFLIMKKRNYKILLDLIFLLLVFSSSWYFKSYLPVELQGAFVIVSLSLVSIFILKKRSLSLEEIGLNKISINNSFFREVITVSILIFLIQALGLLIIGFLLGKPEAGSAIDNQPETLIGFLLDIVFNVWLITAIGEEFIFRGIILNRFSTLFKNKNNKYTIYLVSGLQAIWFGLAHQSQGLSGILITGFIGFALGVYFLKFSKFGLWPLIIAHGLIDTVVLTIFFIR
jgi:membrane protease YdiL (CAAX protease family)